MYWILSLFGSLKVLVLRFSFTMALSLALQTITSSCTLQSLLFLFTVVFLVSSLHVIMGLICWQRRPRSISTLFTVYHELGINECKHLPLPLSVKKYTQEQFSGGVSLEHVLDSTTVIWEIFAVKIFFVGHLYQRIFFP